ncbi:hypothetical protein Zmor_012244 [Zophobas morio]|uniref:Uncharacterized protein n=1 Tax=Zophobas morio TaxID=2755281 RepID=A0AA38LZS0_9CUCU|nr:hypothetical protein Zmor_012244 [Zophobas morio]
MTGLLKLQRRPVSLPTAASLTGRHYMNPSQKIADLRGLGFPVIVALGREMLRSGQEAVEVRLRRDRRKIYIPFDALDTLVEVVRREVVV